MSLFERLRYALYAAAVFGATVGLAIALLSADAVGVLPREAFDWLMTPSYLAAMYVLAFALAPIIAERFPITRRGHQKNGGHNEHAD